MTIPRIPALGVAGILAVLTAFLILLQATTYGPGVSPDSTKYLSAANYLLSTGGFMTFAGPYVSWPPLYPTLLAVSSILHIDPLLFATILNALSIALAILITSIVMFPVFEHKTIAFLALVTVSFSPPLLYVGSFVWSEAPFILFVLAATSTLSVYATRTGRVLLITAAAFCALATLTRLTGVVILPVGVATIFLSACSWRDRLLDSAIFGSIGSIPLAAWLLRNWIDYSTVAGPRQPSDLSYLDSLLATAESLAGFLIPPWRLSFYAWLALGCLFALSILLVAFSWRVRGRSPWRRNVWLRMIPTLSFVVIYLLFLSISISRYDIGPLTLRFLAPMYIPFIVLLFFWIDTFVYSFHKQKVRRVVLAFTSFLCLSWLCIYPIRQTIADVSDRITNGAGGYVRSAWREDTMIDFLQSADFDGVVFSNAADVVFLYTGKEFKEIPTSSAECYDPDNATQILKPVLEYDPGTQPLYIVWIDQKQPTCRFLVPVLIESLAAKSFYQNEHGAIYKVTSP